jgi:hypothetical protein
MYHALVRFALALVAACIIGLMTVAPLATQSAAPPSIFVDASIVDNDGRTIMGLRADELRVTVNGEQRPVVSVRYVYRGTGAATAAALAATSGGQPAAAEPERLVLLVIDEAGIQPGQEKKVVASAKRILDEFSSADAVAVVTMPTASPKFAFETDNAVRTAALSRMVGRAASTSTADAGMADSLRAPVELGQITGSAAAASAAASAEEGRPSNAAVERAADVESEEAHDARLKSKGPALQTLQPIIDAVRGMPGLKTVLVVRQSDAAETTPPQRPADREKMVTAFVEAAARARTSVSLLFLGSANGRRGNNEDDLRSVATATGGTVLAIKNATDTKGLERLSAVIGGSYLIEVEGRATDTPDRTHAVDVKTTRAKASVRTASRWAARTDRVPTIVQAVSQAQGGGAATLTTQPGPETGQADAAAPVTTINRSSRPDPALTLLIAKMREYLAAYVSEFSNVVAEEDYFQDQPHGWTGGVKIRHLRSDLLLVKTDTEIGWAQFRDVFEVDGKPVRDREARVQKLFLDNPATAFDRAAEIASESTRYNVGTLGRTINLPVIPLALLGPTRIGGLAFQQKGEETVQGVRTIRLNYEERRRPTLIRESTTDGDAPSSGAIWVEAATGRIIKTLLKVKALQTEASMTVTYRSGGNTGIWVPAEMEEEYVSGNLQITGKATYKNFRSFKVSTNMELKK